MLHFHLRQPAARRGRSRGERGAALLEAAIVTPLFLALLFGIIEGGMVFYERQSVANMALVGARTASGQGAEVLADYYTLQSVRAGGAGISAGQIKTIVLYRATGPGETVPAGCTTASVTASCNRYAGADLARPATDFGCDGPPAKIDDPWCPTTRKTSISGTNGPPDYIGVYVETLHDDLTGIFGRSITLRSDTIIRIEPRTLT